MKSCRKTSKKSRSLRYHQDQVNTKNPKRSRGNSKRAAIARSLALEL